MTAAVQELLANFDRLSEPEQSELAVEILRRSVQRDALPLSSDTLVALAEELFLELDADEANRLNP